MSKKMLPIRSIVSFFEDDIKNMKTEEDIDRIFNDKVTTALHNFKVDLKNFLKEKNKKEN